MKTRKTSTQAAGGVDGDGPPGLVHRQARVGGQARAHGQLLQGDHRGVGDDADGKPGLVQGAGGGEALVAQFGLALAAQGGPHEHRQALLGQLVSDELAVGAVVQGGLHPEFLGNPHGGEDVVGPFTGSNW